MDSATGNVVIAGTLAHSSTITTNGDVEGQEMRATNGGVITNAPLHVNAVDLSVTSDGLASVFSVAGSTGNTNIAGALTASLGTTLNGGFEAGGPGNTHINGQNFIVTNNIASTASITASTGNVALSGTLSVTSHTTSAGDIDTNLVTATNGAVVSGAALHINAQDLRVSSDGTNNLVHIGNSDGDATIAGTLTIGGVLTLNNGLTVQTSEGHISGQNFKITSNGVAEKV